MSFKVFYFKSLPDSDWSQFWLMEDIPDHFALCEDELILPVLTEYLPTGVPILDAGCGLGRWVAHLRTRGSNVIGMDRSEAALDAGRQFAESLPAACADVQTAPFGDNTFGAVISVGVAEHFERGPEAVFAETLRILKPGGRFFLAVPSTNLFRRVFVNPAIRLRNIKRRLVGYQLEFNEYRYSRHEITRLLARSGFEVFAYYPDDLRLPKARGLITDIQSITGDYSEIRTWQIGGRTLKLARALDRVSPWLCCAGILCVARAPKKLR